MHLRHLTLPNKKYSRVFHKNTLASQNSIHNWFYNQFVMSFEVIFKKIMFSKQIFTLINCRSFWFQVNFCCFHFDNLKAFQGTIFHFILFPATEKRINTITYQIIHHYGIFCFLDHHSCTIAWFWKSPDILYHCNSRLEVKHIYFKLN